MNLFGTVGEDGAITHPDTCATSGEAIQRNLGYKRVNLPNHPKAFVGVWPGIRIRTDRLLELDAEYAASLPTPSPDVEPTNYPEKPDSSPTDKPTKRKPAPKKD